MEPKHEDALQEMVAQYLDKKYPGVQFHSDFGTGTHLSMSQAVRQKKQNAGRKGWPDMFIAHTDYGYLNKIDEKLGITQFLTIGLFLELKVAGTHLKKKNGEWATEHIADQADVIRKLRNEGYSAYFAVGFEEAKMIIDWYLGDHIESEKKFIKWLKENEELYV